MVLKKYLQLYIALKITWHSASEFNGDDIVRRSYPSESKLAHLVKPKFFTIHQQHKCLTFTLPNAGL